MLGFPIMCLSPIEGSEAGAWRRLRKRIPLRNTADALVLYGLLSVFSRTPRDHLSRGGTMHRRLGAPTLIINKKKHTPQSKLLETVPQLSSPSQMTLVCVRLTTANQVTLINQRTITNQQHQISPFRRNCMHGNVLMKPSCQHCLYAILIYGHEPLRKPLNQCFSTWGSPLQGQEIFSQGSSETVRKHSYLYYDSKQ